MLASVKSYALEGLDGYAVSVEVDVNSGLPTVETVGLASTATKESKERVRAAIRNSGFLYPMKRITVNLAPADIKKEGSLLDLPIAVGILVCTECVTGRRYKDFVMAGELALDGSIRHINGVMPLIISAMQRGERNFIVPADDAAEAAYIEGINVYAFGKLADVVDFLNGAPAEPVPVRGFDTVVKTRHYDSDFCHVKGQAVANARWKSRLRAGTTS